MNDANADFETKSGADIKLGLAKYFADPEADALVLRYRLPGGALRQWVAGEDPNPFDLFAHVAAGGRIRGWNVGFEWAAWNLLCVPKYGWPALPIEQCVDTMAEAQAMNLPASLEKCGAALGLPEDKLKSREGKTLIRKLCVPQAEPVVLAPEKYKTSGAYAGACTRHRTWVEGGGRWLTPERHPELHAKLHAYCGQDIVAEESIASKLRRLSDFEQRIWVLTQRINARGIPVAIDEVESIVDVVDAEKERLNRELRVLTKRQVLAATNRGAMLAWINKHPEMQGVDPVFFAEEEDDDLTPLQRALRVHDSHMAAQPYFGDLTKDTVGKSLERDQLPADVRRVLEIRQQVVQTSTAKYPKLLKIAHDDGTLKNMHVYHGAGTGRWASRGGFNVQNLPRPTFSKAEMSVLHTGLGSLGHDGMSFLYGDDLMRAAVCGLRGVLKAPPGYDFIDADYSSVENRVAAWIAGQDDKLAMFAAGLDEYKTFASRTMYKIPYDDVTGAQRQLMKPIILGGIFGLGGKGLVAYAEQYGVTMTEEEGERYIKALREDYDMVRSCWYACGDAAINAIENPGTWFEVRGKLRFLVHKNFLWMKLPSGRPLAWARPIVKMMECPWYEEVFNPDTGEYETKKAWRKGISVESVDTYTRQWCRHKLIGSSIYQSAVQATARDILAHGLVCVEEALAPITRVDPRAGVVLMAHDELVTLVPTGAFDENDMGRLMCTPADWFKDLPLAFEAWRGKRFRK